MMNQRNPSSPPLLVYLYASRDRAWRRRLENQLSISQQQGKLQQWHRDAIQAGEKPEVVLQEQLTRAAAIVLLLSPELNMDDFFRYFRTWQETLPRASTPQIVPILIRPTLDQGYYAGSQQILPRNKKALSTWKDEDKAAYEVTREILSLIEQYSTPGNE